jgi:hypothetical protein
LTNTQFYTYITTFPIKIQTPSPRDPAIGLFYWVLGRAYFVVKITATQLFGCGNQPK